MGSAGFGGGELGPARSTGGRLSLRACEQFVGARGASRSTSRDLPSETRAELVGPQCFLEVACSKTHQVPTLQSARVFRQPHPMVGSWHLQAGGGGRRTSQACGVCFPARQRGPELENRSDWGPKSGSAAARPRHYLGSVWPEEGNPVEVPGQALPEVRLG